jgi:single-strand DNA-binding protein
MFETDWTPVEAWVELAETCGRYIRNGSRVRVTGSLLTRSWDDRESGQKRFKAIVRANEVLFLDARPDTPDEAVQEAVEDPHF